MSTTKKDERNSDFADCVNEQRAGLLSEFWGFLKHTKKWWLLPLLVMLLLFGLLIFLSGTAAAPFIYTLF